MHAHARLETAVLGMAALVLFLGGAGGAKAGTINPGDLIVTDFATGTVDDVNPTTGGSFVIASGFSNDQGVAVSPTGQIYVLDIGTSTIYKVDPTTDQVTPFSSNGIGTGTAVTRPFQMAFHAGTLYVADGGTPNGNTTSVYTIDSSGNRTLVAGNNGSSRNVFDRSLGGLAIDSKGNIYASASTAEIADHVPPIYHVAPGTPTALSTTAVTVPWGLAIDPKGQLLADFGGPLNPSIWSINPATEQATDLSDNNGVGSGQSFGNLHGIMVAPDGSIYATDQNNGNGVIFKVDPTTGNRTIVSGEGVGGATFGGLSYGTTALPSTLAPPPRSPSQPRLLSSASER